MVRNHETEPRNEVRSWFLVKSVLRGSAPLRIKEQWVGVLLPLRYDKFEGPDSRVAEDLATQELVLISDGIYVDTPDAIQALRLFGRNAAADFWVDQSMRDHGEVSSRHWLGFYRDEGSLLPITTARLRFPQIEGFIG